MDLSPVPAACCASLGAGQPSRQSTGEGQAVGAVSVLSIWSTLSSYLGDPPLVNPLRPDRAITPTIQPEQSRYVFL